MRCKVPCSTSPMKLISNILMSLSYGRNELNPISQILLTLASTNILETIHSISLTWLQKERHLSTKPNTTV